jgi:hypothetical protein
LLVIKDFDAQILGPKLLLREFNHFILMYAQVVEKLQAVGLEEILRKTLDQPRKSIVPLVNVVRRELVPVQTSFLNPAPVENKNFGDFYERMVQAWYGGERNVNQAIYFNGKVYFSSHKPDLVSDTFIYDQKGLGPTTQMKLRDKQMCMYLMLQALYPHKRVAHQVFRHSVKNVKNREEPYTLGNLYKDLSQNTLYGLDLHLSIMYALWSIKRPEEINDRFDYLLLDPETREEFSPKQLKVRMDEDHYTGVKASTMHCFFYSPKLMLRALGLNPKWYSVSRHLSPERVVMEGNRVRQFPVVSINHKHPTAWLHYLYNSIKPQQHVPDDFCNDLSDADESMIDSVADINKKYRYFKPNSGPKVNGYISRIRKYPDIAGVLNPVREEPVDSYVDDSIPF